MAYFSNRRAQTGQTYLQRLAPLMLLLIILPMTLTGCQSAANYFAGTRVEPNLQVPLHPGESKSGVWQTFEMIIQYSADMGQENLRISGQAQLSQHYQLLYHRLSRFDLYLFLLDGESRVLKTVSLHPGLLLDTEDEIPFDRTIALPARTEAISFGYSGKVDSSEDDTDIFWELPLPD